MKRILGLLVLAMFVATTAMAVGQAAAPAPQSGAVAGAAALQKEPYFRGIGFAFKGADGGQTVVEVEITKIIQAGANGKSGAGTFIVSGGADQPPAINSNVNSASGPATFVGVLVYGAGKFPMKLIKSDLTAFEADLYDPADLAAREKGLRVPCGHVSFKVAEADAIHQVAEGTLKIKTPADKASGEYRLLLNELKPPAPPAGAGAAAGAGSDSDD